MTDQLVMDLVEKGLVTDRMVLTVGYDRQNLDDPARAEAYDGALVKDYYGRLVPKHAHGTANLSAPTSSTREITEAVMDLFDRVVDPKLLVRRLNVTADNIAPESDARSDGAGEQMDLFRDFAPAAESETKPKDPERERRRQDAVLAIRRRYGKNAILKGMNLEEGATARDRNSQIGGHKA